MAFYPSTVATTAQLYEVGNRVESTLASVISDTDTTISLVDASRFPSSANFVNLIGSDNSDPELISYTGKSGNSLTGVTRGIFSTAAAHGTSTRAYLSIAAEHHEVTRDEIIAIETALGANPVASAVPLNNLNDVDAAAPADGEVLTWVDANSAWEPAAGGGGAGTLTATLALGNTSGDNPIVMDNTTAAYAVAVPDQKPISFNGITNTLQWRGEVNEVRAAISGVDRFRIGATAMRIQAGTANNASLTFASTGGGDKASFVYDESPNDFEIWTTDSTPPNLARRVSVAGEQDDTEWGFGGATLTGYVAALYGDVKIGDGTTNPLVYVDHAAVENDAFVCEERGRIVMNGLGGNSYIQNRSGVRIYSQGNLALNCKATDATNQQIANNGNFNLRTKDTATNVTVNLQSSAGVTYTQMEYRVAGNEFNFSTQNAALSATPSRFAIAGEQDDTEVVIGTNAVTVTSAVLALTSTTGALLLPRMTTAERGALTAANGMVVYDTDVSAFYFYEGGAWVTGSGLT